MKKINTISIFKSPAKQLSIIQNKIDSENRLTVQAAIATVELILASDGLTDEGEYSEDGKN